MAIRTDYQVAVIDHQTGDTLDIIQQKTWQMLQYKRVLNGIGSLALTLPATYTRALTYKDKIDTILEVYRRNTAGKPLEKEESYLLRITQTYSDDSGNDWIVLGGSSLNDLIKRRVLVLEDDPNSAGGYLTYRDVASTVMSSFTRYQLIEPQVNSDRSIINLSLGTIGGGNTISQRRQFGSSLLEILQQAQVEGDVDFQINRATRNSFTFNATQIGTDRTITTNFPGNPFVVFAPQRGNIIGPSLKINRTDEINAVWVQGQGPDNDRDKLEVTDASAIAISLWNRREGTTDSRDTELGVIDGLQTSGESFLRDNRPRIEFEFTPDLRVRGAQYNRDWFFGDRVTAKYLDEQQDLRIQAITVQLNSSGENIDILLENV